MGSIGAFNGREERGFSRPSLNIPANPLRVVLDPPLDVGLAGRIYEWGGLSNRQWRTPRVVPIQPRRIGEPQLIARQTALEDQGYRILLNPQDA